MGIDIANVRAIDMHVHAEVSCHDPEDPVMGAFFDAASAYFKAPRERPKMLEIVELYLSLIHIYRPIDRRDKIGPGIARIGQRGLHHRARAGRKAEQPDPPGIDSPARGIGADKPQGCLLYTSRCV